MPRLSSLLVRAGSVPLLALGAALHDPYLLPVRSWAPPALCLLAVAAMLWLLAQRNTDPMALLLWAAILLLPLGEEIQITAHKQRVLAQSADATALGRHFIVGYSRYEEIAPLAYKGLIGGIFIGRHEDAETLRRDIAKLQSLRKLRGLPPLLVATDQEGGIVSRLSPPLPRQPPLSDLAGLLAQECAAAARYYGREQGSGLASLGITVNFAPVVDLKGTAPRWDRNSFIFQRAISDDPDRVGEIATAYAEGLRLAHVMPTAKHFPGLGRAQGDTHHVRVRLNASVEELEGSDWRPFRRMLKDGPAFLMVGHVILDAVDPVQPASASRPVIDGLLRARWGFDGVIVTDDLTMPSFFHHDFCGGVVRSLNAGADLLLISYDTEQYYRAFECTLDGLRDGGIDRQMLDRSSVRLSRKL